MNVSIKKGDFIRVRADHFNPSRAGKDGMVMEGPMEHPDSSATFKPDDMVVALSFGHDRYNQPQKCECVGPELWFLMELDLNTLES